MQKIFYLVFKKLGSFGFENFVDSMASHHEVVTVTSLGSKEKLMAIN